MAGFAEVLRNIHKRLAAQELTKHLGCAYEYDPTACSSNEPWKALIDAQPPCLDAPLMLPPAMTNDSKDTDHS